MILTQKFIKKVGLSILAMSIISFLVISCSPKPGQGFNLFSLEDEMVLGKQVKTEIENNPTEYPVLPEQGNTEIYKYIRGLSNSILNSGKLTHRNEFAWEVKIIDDPETLNAFCTPGGYIYVYTGLIKFLDSEDELLGVLAHEIAHADLRHSTRQLTKIMGLQVLLSVVSGSSDPTMVEQIALALSSLKFSRTHEIEADEHSVLYLCNSGYNAAGAAGFFEKLESSSAPPEFLSTHPNPGNRVESINMKEEELGCTGNNTNISRYTKMKKLL
jgi:predicted Zn-dependent protease